MSALNRVKLLGRENCDSLTVYQADAEQKLLDQAAARKAEERQERREQRAADSRVLRAEVESLRTEVERLRTELLEAERRQIEGLELTAEHIAQLADRVFQPRHEPIRRDGRPDRESARQRGRGRARQAAAQGLPVRRGTRAQGRRGRRAAHDRDVRENLELIGLRLPGASRWTRSRKPGSRPDLRAARVSPFKEPPGGYQIGNVR